jgi:excisionase family DNA binding protein
MADAPEPAEVGAKIEEIIDALRASLNPGERLLTLRHAAERLDVSYDHVRHLVHSGQLDAHDIAINPDRPMYRIRESELHDYIRKLTRK